MPNDIVNAPRVLIRLKYLLSFLAGMPWRVLRTVVGQHHMVHTNVYVSPLELDRAFIEVDHSK